MTPAGLIMVARTLLSLSFKGQNAEALRRSVSTTYYAAFHCLAAECADLLIGATDEHRSDPTWRQVYRALDHGTARAKCNNKQTLRRFPKTIADFASVFVEMQEKRHDADYDPFLSLSPSAILADIDNVEAAIANYKTCAVKDRRAFCAHVLFRDRT